MGVTVLVEVQVQVSEEALVEAPVVEKEPTHLEVSIFCIHTLRICYHNLTNNFASEFQRNIYKKCLYLFSF